MTYPVEMRWMYVSTEPAGRAVKAAELQSDEVAGAVLRRLREATFVFGTPPDTPERIRDAVRGVEGLDEDRLLRDLDSEVAEKAFREDWEETRRPNDHVMHLEGDRPGIGSAKHTEGHWRYVFPTLIFRGSDGEATVPGWCPYEDYEEAMETARRGSTRDARPNPSPEEVLATWPTASAKELEVLCNPGARAPAGVVAHDWGEGVFYLAESEARARRLPGWSGATPST